MSPELRTVIALAIAIVILVALVLLFAAFIIDDRRRSSEYVDEQLRALAAGHGDARFIRAELGLPQQNQPGDAYADVAVPLLFLDREPGDTRQAAPVRR